MHAFLKLSVNNAIMMAVYPMQKRSSTTKRLPTYVAQEDLAHTKIHTLLNQPTSQSQLNVIATYEINKHSVGINNDQCIGCTSASRMSG